MPAVEFLTTRCAWETDGAGLTALAAVIEEVQGAAPAWRRYEDGGLVPRRILQARGLALFAAQLGPDRHLAYRLDTGLSAGDARGWIPAIASAVRAAGGVLDGAYRDSQGEDLPPPPARSPSWGAIGALSPAPLPDVDELDPLEPPPIPPPPAPLPGDEDAARAADPATPAEELAELTEQRRLAPWLAVNPSLSEAGAQRLLGLLNQRGPWDTIHALARHPVWGDARPPSLQRTPFADAPTRQRWHAILGDLDRDLTERAIALDRLLGWSCEVDLDTHNLAPWLPIDVPVEVLVAFLEPAVRADPVQEEDGGFDDHAACWSLPPARPGRFQRLLAVWRHPLLPAELRPLVLRALGSCPISPGLRDALRG